jgi:hypothetical protein
MILVAALSLSSFCDETFEKRGFLNLRKTTGGKSPSIRVSKTEVERGI